MAEQGWYADPTGRPGILRFWNGTTWTDQTMQAVTSLPPPSGSPVIATPTPVGTPPQPAYPRITAPYGSTFPNGPTQLGGSSNAGRALLMVGSLLVLSWPLVMSAVTSIRLGSTYRAIWIDTPISLDRILVSGWMLSTEWGITWMGLAYSALMLTVVVMTAVHVRAGAIAALVAALISLVMLAWSFSGLLPLGRYIEFSYALRPGQYLLAAGVLAVGGIVALRSNAPSGTTGQPSAQSPAGPWGTDPTEVSSPLR